MSFVIAGLSPEEFAPLYGLDEAALAARGVVRKIADRKPGYPCRVTLQDAEPGERVLLLNHESHKAATPYRSAYAIYVREGASAPARHVDEIPPVLRGRPIALRIFDAGGMLIGADLALSGEPAENIRRALDNPQAAYIDAHNAAYGCFAARVQRA
ncbi:DUF1203 domain-containing protein [Amphiplicatus metriothermophilus]|uniref:DUF1203 domain-containing protein n=1 Tax=Amphiplicatus metriothermophilus TaxID=1519374 RepID=A0A239PKE5_9PROT|nr:DUF1203 domain-containing protein [Amphiplicatus metriothermophilus]MBB5518142.1 hypothetical protein [Amphiplicatus metriothermophilus]SNT67524.1 Protein of unknown function [Amphiplicatus metriothermophilus]